MPRSERSGVAAIGEDASARSERESVKRYLPVVRDRVDGTNVIADPGNVRTLRTELDRRRTQDTIHMCRRIVRPGGSGLVVRRNGDVVEHRSTGPVGANPDVDAALSDWIDGLLVKACEDRTQSAIQAWDSLEEIIERLLGPRFDAHKFHDFILEQGLLPPDLLRKAVLEQFVPTLKPVMASR